ncbi:MAG: hypothetical protein R3B57_05935 [Phycisphaerales bacterium]
MQARYLSESSQYRSPAAEVLHILAQRYPNVKQVSEAAKAANDREIKKLAEIPTKRAAKKQF